MERLRQVGKSGFVWLFCLVNHWKCVCCNRNVGYFGLSKVDFSRNAYTPSLISVVKRWRLEPKDPEAYLKGELVEPIKQIVFYIDRNTPSRWVPFFIEAVNAWQESFERIGFKNAIRGELAPTPEENPEFSEDDTRYSFISWKTSFIQNAYGPSTVGSPLRGDNYKPCGNIQ